MDILVIFFLSLLSVLTPLVFGWLVINSFLRIKRSLGGKNNYRIIKYSLVVLILVVIDILGVHLFSALAFPFDSSSQLISLYGLKNSGFLAKIIAIKAPHDVFRVVMNLLALVVFFLQLLIGYFGINALKQIRMAFLQKTPIALSQWFVAVAFFSFMMLMIFVVYMSYFAFYSL